MSTSEKNHLDRVSQRVSFSCRSSYCIPDALGLQNEIRNFANLLRKPSSCDQGTIEFMSRANVSSSVNLIDAYGLRTSVS